MDVFIRVRENKNTPGGLLVAEGELIEPFHFLTDVLIGCPVVALCVEPVAVSVFDAFRDALALHVDQIQHRLHGFVVLTEKLVFVLEPCAYADLRQPFSPPLVVRQDEPDPRLVFVLNQLPAFRHNVHDACWCAVLRPGLDEESVVPRTQHRSELIKELAPFLEAIRPHLQPALKLRHRRSFQVRL